MKKRLTDDSLWSDPAKRARIWALWHIAKIAKDTRYDQLCLATQWAYAEFPEYTKSQIYKLYDRGY